MKLKDMSFLHLMKIQYLYLRTENKTVVNSICFNMTQLIEFLLYLATFELLIYKIIQ